MRATRLRTEYLDRPLGLGIRMPRLSWNAEGGIAQTAYRIVATRDGAEVWDTGRVESPRMTHVRYEGEPLGSRDRVEWTVTLWDERGTEGEAVASWFELGLLEAHDWQAHWVTGDYTPKKNVRYPVDHFRIPVDAGDGIRRARLYITALGLYEARIGGVRVGEARLAPGSTDYAKRLQYQAYDVTGMLGGHDALEIALADGWYRGSIGCFGQTNVFGRQTKLLAQLEIDYADGGRQVIVTDDTTAWSNDGPVRFADLKDGEVVDVRLTPSYRGRARLAFPGPVPVASDNVVPVAREEFTPTLLTTPSGARVLDFGQNIAGFVGFRMSTRDGQRIRLRLGETLDPAGEFTQANFQKSKPVKEFGRVSEFLLMIDKPDLIRGELQATPLQQVDVTCREGITDYTTEFAVFGFRYALVETDAEIDPADFRAIAVYSDLEQTGEFTCSNPLIDRLVENTRWSMKGNFLDVPTDCPTRERLGWTGDAQIFFDTAASFMDVAAFFRKWLRDVQDAQVASGRIPAVVPLNGVDMMYTSTGAAVGWGDAAVLIPYRFWKRYGDEELLRDSYPLMRDYGRYMIDHAGPKNRRAHAGNPDARYLYEKGMHLGEWLEPEEFRDDPRDRSVSYAEEATAYLHYTMRHLAEVASALGEAEDEALFAEYAAGAKRAYRHLVLPDGEIDTDRQAKLVRPLALGLVDGDDRLRVEERLVQAVEAYRHRVGTGFLSTPFLLPVLTEAGRTDVAYRMLENTESPSWLAEVVAGATTVWEHWEGTESLNHYSPGAVCQWLFDTVAGIRVTGERRFAIAPVPGGSVTHASASYLSPYGSVASRWELTDAGFALTVEVPANTTALVTLPDGAEHEVAAGRHAFATEVAR